MGIELMLYLIERHGEAIELPLLAHQINSRILKLGADESDILHIHHLIAILIRHQESLTILITVSSHLSKKIL